MPTKWLQERANGSKNEHGMPPRRAFCGQLVSQPASTGACGRCGATCRPPFTHLPTLSCVHSLTHSLVHSFTQSPTHLFTHTLTQSLTHSRTRSLTPSLPHPLTGWLTDCLIKRETETRWQGCHARVLNTSEFPTDATCSRSQPPAVLSLRTRDTASHVTLSHNWSKKRSA